MIWMLVLLIVVVAASFWRWFSKLDHCPKCKATLDSDHHGYQQKYSHCHNCGYCTQKGCGL